MILRILTAAAVLVSAAVHFDLWPAVRDNEVIGPAFLINGIGGVVIALLVLFWRHWLPPLLAIGFGLSTIGGFVISATVGMYGVHEHWKGFSVWAAFIAEVVAVVAGGLLLLRQRPVRSGAAAQSGQHASSANLH
jgi:hypothetical protein